MLRVSLAYPSDADLGEDDAAPGTLTMRIGLGEAAFGTLHSCFLTPLSCR